MNLNKLKAEAHGLVEWGISMGLITRPGRQMTPQEQDAFLSNWNQKKRAAEKRKGTK